MNEIFINLRQLSFKPNDEIKGSVHWVLDKEPKDMAVRLFWYTRGRGTEDLSIVASVSIPPKKRGEADFHFPIPAGPYTFSGKLISVIWAIECVANPSDECARQEITVSPTGEEILLGQGYDKT